jgi:SDR family mycofactocin-dependent oxidoreductase
MGSLTGKVAFITGAARGQGRAHAVRLAQEGADIIGVDICEHVATVKYPLSTLEDLQETVRLVEEQDQRMVAMKADVRDAARLAEAVAEGISTFGRLDIVLANAGIRIGGSDKHDAATLFRDVIDINLIGVWNTIEAALPPMIEKNEGGSIVITSSVAGLKGVVTALGTGTAAYAAAKAGLGGLMRRYANLLAPYSIRVNTVHPTGVDTPMLVGFQDEYAEFMGQLPAVSSLREQRMTNALPVSLIQPQDISNAIAWLVSDAARYVTGVALPIDAGMTNT